MKTKYQSSVNLSQKRTVATENKCLGCKEFIFKAIHCKWFDRRKRKCLSVFKMQIQSHIALLIL